MESKAINKAQGRLQAARRRLRDVINAETGAEFVGEWHGLLVSAKGVYTMLEQGAKSSPKSRYWFGKKKNFRKGDPLLTYMFQARNDDEHGLEYPLDVESGRTFIDVNQGESVFNEPIAFNGKIGGSGFRNLKMSGGRALNAPTDSIESLSVESRKDVSITTTQTPERIVLATVRGRGTDRYTPPTSHLGVPIEDTSPAGVASLYLDYLESMLAAARQLVESK